jgi:hypothetical protein
LTLVRMLEVMAVGSTVSSGWHGSERITWRMRWVATSDEETRRMQVVE